MAGGPKLGRLRIVKTNKNIFALIVSLIFFVTLLFVPISSRSPNAPKQNLVQKILDLGGITNSNETTLILGGDVMLGRTVMTTSLDKNDVNYPFANISSYLKNADLVFVNLENPVIDGCPRSFEGLVFCADPKMVEGLKNANIGVVNLANNHIHNYGDEGLGQTKQYLNKSGISFTGDGNLAIKDIHGIRFGFLGFEMAQQSDPKLTEEQKQLIIDSNNRVDVLVVAMHWGIEYKDKPTVGQEALAKEIVGLGADVVVGHHPHWVQTVGNIDGVPVYYSLGNLVFDQMWSEKTRSGLLVKLTFSGKKIVNEELVKTYMDNWAQPKIVN